MFAGCERGNRDFGMRVVRRADRHKFDRRVVHHRLPIIGISAESKGGCTLRSALLDYKYQAPKLSFLETLCLDGFWDWLANSVYPNWLAPNMLTLLGGASGVVPPRLSAYVHLSFSPLEPGTYYTRIYVLLLSAKPLRIYWFKDVLVRFATQKYDLDDLDNSYAHLTNTSINKNSTSYSRWMNAVERTSAVDRCCRICVRHGNTTPRNMRGIAIGQMAMKIPPIARKSPYSLLSHRTCMFV